MEVTQKEALVAIKNWLEDDKNRVFSLAGAFSTGKTRVLENALAECERNSKELFFVLLIILKKGRRVSVM